MNFIAIVYSIIVASCLTITVNAVGQSTIQCTITCRGDNSCQTQLIASDFRYPGEVRQGSCDKIGQCSQDYTVHCQKCFDYCQRQGPGQYDTAVITLAFNPNKPDENVNKRPDPVTCITLQSTQKETVNRELIQAAKDIRLLQCLLPRIDIEAATNYKYTLLILASANGNLEVVNYLLNKGANVRAKTDQGVSSFSLAAEKGHLEIVKALYRKNSSILEQKDKKGRTALIWAAMKGHLDVVKFLVSENADTNLQSNEGETPLLVASTNNHDDVVNFLTGRENTVTGTLGGTTTGRFPANNDVLISEASKGKWNTVRSLINNRNMNYQDKNGKTALIAAAENGHEQLVSELITFGVDVNLKKQNGISALHLESQNGHLQNVQALLLKADNINALAPYKFKKNYTPLIFAAINGHAQVVSEFLQKGANVEQKTQDGFNAILWAAKNNHENVVKVIIDKAYPNVAKLFVDSFDYVSRISCN